MQIYPGKLNEKKKKECIKNVYHIWKYDPTLI